MTAHPAVPAFSPTTTNQVVLDYLTNQRAYLTGLFGADGEIATAMGTLGVLIGAGVQVRSSSATLSAADRGRLMLASGTITLTLPTVATAGAGWSIVVDNTGTGAVTLDGAGSETVDGAASAILPRDRAAIVVCTGTAWVTMAMPGSAGGPVLFGPGSVTPHGGGVGSAAVPGLAVAGNTNTGLVSPAANQLGFVTDGIQRLLLTTTALTASVQFLAQSGTQGAPGIGFAAQPSSGMWRIGSTAVGMAVNGVEAARFTSTGRMGMNADPETRIHIAGGATDADSRIMADRVDNSATGPRLVLRKARGALGAPEAMNVGDTAGLIGFSGYDGSGWNSLVTLFASADTGFGPGNTPGRLIVSTVTPGGTVLAERMRIDAAGVKVTGRIEVNGAPFWGRQVVIANNAVAIVTPDFTGGELVMTVGGGVGFTTTDDGACANIHFDVGTSHFIEKQGGWTTRGTLVDTSLAILTGTTGTLGRITVSARPDGTLMVENRLGASKTVRLWGQ